MKTGTRIAAVAVLGAGLAATTLVTTADAQGRRTRNAIIGGVVAGAIIAGAAGAYASSPGYARRGPGCGEYRRRAVISEQRGDFGRARYWWDRFESCRAY